MDPLSQGLLGSALSTASEKKPQHILSAVIIGALAGMAPDLDVLIKSNTDLLLNLEYHRHFTHSLFFAPIGAFIVAVVLYPLFKKKLSLKRTYYYSFLGFITHGFLDSCTSYGTRLLWPFSDMRVAWNNVSIVDPVFTLTLLIGVILGVTKKKSRPILISLVLSSCYLLFGVYQREKAEEILHTELVKNNIEYTRLEAKPSVLNNILWRGIYETKSGILGAYAIHILPFSKPQIMKGETATKFSVEDYLATIKDINRRYDIKRYQHFSDDMLIWHPSGEEDVLGDFRYALLPHQIYPLWGIKLPKDITKRAYPVNFRSMRKEKRDQFIDMIINPKKAFKLL